MIIKNKKNKIVKLLLKHTLLSNDICNVVFLYVNCSYKNLLKSYKSNLNKGVQQGFKLIDVLDIIAECCSRGYVGFTIPDFNHSVSDYYKEQVNKKYNNILEYSYFEPLKFTLIQLKNIKGIWINIYMLSTLFSPCI